MWPIQDFSMTRSYRNGVLRYNVDLFPASFILLPEKC